MASEKEIAIRISSPMPFIDDEEEEDQKDQKDSKELKKVHYNFKITQNYQNNTSNIEISKELQEFDISNDFDVITHRPLSPVAPLGDDDSKPSFEMVIHEPNQTEKQPCMRLLIKGRKSIISIDGFETEESKKNEEGDILEFLNTEVAKIFKKPDKKEIEKVVKNVMKSEKSKNVCRFFKTKPKSRKTATWKILTKSFLTVRGRPERRGSDERYPKMVLLKDTKEDFKKKEKNKESYPKMVMLEKNPKGLNEISIEQHVIDMEKKHLEKEKINLKDEKKGLQVEKQEIEKEKHELKKERKYLHQEMHILDEKKMILEEEKSLLCDRKTEGSATKFLEKEMNILGEEKLCIEIEKQLLDEEKHMLEEEKDILKKEKDVLEKEKCILGEEKNVLEEEKSLLVKEKFVFEKQKSFMEETGFSDKCEDDERTGESEANGSEEESSEKESSESTEVEQYRKKNKKVLHEIQDVFQDTLKMYPKPEEGVHRPEAPFNYPYYDPYYYHYPSVYVPVYNPPYYRCCGARTQNSTTQTSIPKVNSESQTQFPDQEMKEELKEEDMESPGLPFGLLSSFFPRVVIMKTMRDNLEENDLDEPKGKIVEIGKDALEENAVATATEASPPQHSLASQISGRREREEKGSPVSPLPKIVINENINLLKIPTSDLSIRAKSISKTGENTESEETETEESGINTGCASEDFCLKTGEEPGLTFKEKFQMDRTIPDFWGEHDFTIEHLHFGDGDTENDSLRPDNSWEKKLTGEEKREAEGHKDKKELESQERGSRSANLPLTKIGHKIYDKLNKISLDRDKSPKKESKEETFKSPCNIRLDINQQTIHVSVPEEQINFEISNPVTKKMKIGVVNDKSMVRKSELWHSENPKKDESKNVEIRVEDKEQQEISVSLSDDRTIVFSIKMDDQRMKEEKETCRKITHEVQIGTDDLYVAGGNFDDIPGTSKKNLSPRTGKLLKTLEEKLEIVEGKKRASILKKTTKKEAENWQKREVTLPGIFLVKQISPKERLKPMVEVGKQVGETSGKAREYYCEECLATMRLLEDECLSVKNMVDKFETIIQLGSY